MATTSFCPVCGQPSRAGAVHASHSAPATNPAKPAPTLGSKILGLVIVIGVLYFVFHGSGSSTGSNGSNSTGSGGGGGGGGAIMTGTFISWEPVSDGNGYAYFSVTNSGTGVGTAKCTVEVRDDFGDFGFDYLVGETVQPGQTIRGKIPLSVGKNAGLINAGDVKDC